MHHTIKIILSDLSLKRAWLLVFLFTSIIIILIQLILLPYFFSNWHGGYGLLAGGDSLSFHKVAVELSESIRREGWSAWELRPGGWMPAGVAGAIYALTTPQPWSLIPLNAAVHASTFIIVAKILMFVEHRVNIALLSALPFAFFPSAMLWYTQIHRDGYQILGTLLFLLGFLSLVLIKDTDWLKIAKGFCSAVAGVIIVWLARPYSVVIFLYAFILLIFIVSIYFLILVLKSKITFSESALKVLLLIILAMGMILLTQTEGASKYHTAIFNETVFQTVVVDQADTDSETGYSWVRLPWLPYVVDNQLYSIAYLRAVTYQERYGETASGIDYHITFHNGYDFILYLPRALQIAFLSPFPVDWFGEGKYEATTFFRRVSAFEMVFIYLSMPLLLYGIWIWRKKIQLWLIVVFCSIMMMPLVYSVPNVGTLYRYRYGYLMLLVGVGLLACDTIIQKQYISTKNVQKE